MESINKEQKKNEKSIKYKKEYNAKLVMCECGLMCRYSNLFRHYKSYKHTTYLESL
jgi:hypothetical protein